MMNIFDAITRRDLAALAGLDAAGANARDGDGFTPLMNAVLEDGTDPAIVRLLIERGADVNAAEPGQSWTALHFAARGQKEQIVRALLDAGATVDAVDVFGNTPLWRATMAPPAPDLAVPRLLLGRGSDPNRKNNHGSTPLEIARRTGREGLVALFEGKSP
jgi:ankyrin repeat protein